MLISNRLSSPHFSLETAVLLFFAAMVGGALNAVAGGGSFIAFPTLLFTGVPAIPANATNTVALWTGLAFSGGALLRHPQGGPPFVMSPARVSSLGGVSGGPDMLV